MEGCSVVLRQKRTGGAAGKKKNKQIMKQKMTGETQNIAGEELRKCFP